MIARPRLPISIRGFLPILAIIKTEHIDPTMVTKTSISPAYCTNPGIIFFTI